MTSAAKRELIESQKLPEPKVKPRSGIFDSRGLRLLRPEVRDYPMLYVWLKEQFPNLSQNRKVWKALLKYGHLSEHEGKLLLKGEIGPAITVEELNGPLSEFDPTIPGKIALSRQLIEEWQSDAASKSNSLERVVLHELIHWANYAKGIEERNEAGDMFEREAYAEP